MPCALHTPGSRRLPSRGGSCRGEGRCRRLPHSSTREGRRARHGTRKRRVGGGRRAAPDGCVGPRPTRAGWSRGAWVRTGRRQARARGGGSGERRRRGRSPPPWCGRCAPPPRCGRRPGRTGWLPPGNRERWEPAWLTSRTRRERTGTPRDRGRRVPHTGHGTPAPTARSRPAAEDGRWGPASRFALPPLGLLGSAAPAQRPLNQGRPQAGQGRLGPAVGVDSPLFQTVEGCPGSDIE